MAPFNFPSLRFHPHRYRAGGLDFWSGHLPFACDLVAELRPSLIVELGSQFGESYFTFCQSVSENQIPSTCYSIDTWLGDDHTGSYGEEVFQDVSQHNNRFYRSFSYLLRMTFDDALGQFADESIDLLHIDGLHTYEAVRHDFEAWFPKVKPGGVILLHDVAVRHSDFGVWRIWTELAAQYPAFMFFHCSGLGVLWKPGKAIDTSPLLSLLFGQNASDQQLLRDYYVFCAEMLDLRDRNAKLERGQQRCEFYSQVFWALESGQFDESMSVSSKTTVENDRTVIRLTIPPLPCSPVGLRLDIADRPVFLRVFGVRLRDQQGNTVWAAEDVADLDTQFSHMQVIPAVGKTEGFFVRATNEDPAILLPLNARILSEISGGACLELDICPVSLADGLSILSGELVASGEYIRSLESELYQYREQGGLARPTTNQYDSQCRADGEQKAVGSPAQRSNA